ncbi:hypothetical protein FOA52_002880 [Chlamydomonas sp. UWO 241]|nr:hypothetical protein FOA52_002880 [Chlamydomonas sp. UWO 241]
MSQGALPMQEDASAMQQATPVIQLELPVVMVVARVIDDGPAGGTLMLRSEGRKPRAPLSLVSAVADDLSIDVVSCDQALRGAWHESSYVLAGEDGCRLRADTIHVLLAALAVRLALKGVVVHIQADGGSERRDSPAAPAVPPPSPADQPPAQLQLPAAPWQGDGASAAPIRHGGDEWVQAGFDGEAFSLASPVDHIMTRDLHWISKDADLAAAKAQMHLWGTSFLMVDTGRPQPGFLTTHGWWAIASNALKTSKVSTVMAVPVISLPSGTPVTAALQLMQAKRVRRVAVHNAAALDANVPSTWRSSWIGVVSDMDVFRCFGAMRAAPARGASASLSAVAQQGGGGAGAAGTDSPVGLGRSSGLDICGSGGGSFSAGAAGPGAALFQPGAGGAGDDGLLAMMARQLSGAPSSGASSIDQLAPALSSQSQRAAPRLLGNTSGMSLAHGSTASLTAAAVPPAATVTTSASGGRSISTEDRFRTAASLWELDYDELDIIRKIGEGSFGEVMLAMFRGTKVAAKRIRAFDSFEEGGPSPTLQPVLASFFEREIEILATMRHPNVVNFVGACHTPPNVCLVTEYCARGSLDTLLHRSGLQLDVAKKVEMAMDIARGMSCLHAQKPPIIHRDLKTANLLVSARFEVKVGDFGLSRIKDHAQLVNSRAGLEGTVEYCAPEVLRGEPYTEKCDVWSYGVVLWELFNRARPFADADVPIFLLMMSLGNGSLRLPPLRPEATSPGLAHLLERCLSWEPTDRPSFRELLLLLEHEYKVVRGKAAAVPRSDSAVSLARMASGAEKEQVAARAAAAAAAARQAASQAGDAAQGGRGGSGGAMSDRSDASGAAHGARAAPDGARMSADAVLTPRQMQLQAHHAQRLMARQWRDAIKARTARAASLPAPESLDDVLDAATAAAAAAVSKHRVNSSNQRIPSGATDGVHTSSELNTPAGAASGQPSGIGAPFGSAGACGGGGDGPFGAAGGSPFDGGGDGSFGAAGGEPFDVFDAFGAAAEQPFAWDSPAYDAFGAFADGLPAWDAPSRMATFAGHDVSFAGQVDDGDAAPTTEQLSAQLSVSGGDTGAHHRAYDEEMTSSQLARLIVAAGGSAAQAPQLLHHLQQQRTVAGGLQAHAHEQRQRGGLSPRGNSSGGVFGGEVGALRTRSDAGPAMASSMASAWATPSLLSPLGAEARGGDGAGPPTSASAWLTGDAAAADAARAGDAAVGTAAVPVPCSTRLLPAGASPFGDWDSVESSIAAAATATAAGAPPMCDLLLSPAVRANIAMGSSPTGGSWLGPGSSPPQSGAVLNSTTTTTTTTTATWMAI